MTESRLSGVGRRCERRWSFAACVFDEANWALILDGRRVSVETKPLELLRNLLLHAGNVVSKEELLNAIWPNVTVVEASLPTAIRKLRLALGDDRRERSIIETVPGIGYRLAVPVDVLELPDPSSSPSAVAQSLETIAVERRPLRMLHFSMVMFVLALAVAGILLIPSPLWPPQTIAAHQSTPVFSQREVGTALRRIDVEKIEKMLAAGWDPTTPLDKDRNGALNMLLNNCEWDPGHDQRRMLLMARTLIDGGERLDHRNVWGDTPYSIAKAQRYCGPDHPVTQMIRTLCYSGFKPAGDRCLAAYETKPREKNGPGRDEAGSAS